MRLGRRPRWILSTMLLALCVAAPLGFGGCGQTAPTLTLTSAGKVDPYFGGPFNTNYFTESVSTFDHSTGEINVSGFVSTTHGSVPSGVLSGTFTAAPTGFLGITENFATVNSVLIAKNPPVTGAWAVEIPGAGALGNFLAVNTTGGGLPLQAAPVAVAENTACPNFPNTAAPFLYVTIPGTTPGTDTADYGGVKISTEGSDVTLNAQPYLIASTTSGPTTVVPTTVTGGCSQTYFGPLTAYPLNSFATPSNLELINFGQSGLLVSSYLASPSVTPGAFGGGTGVIGVAESSSPVNVSAVVAAQYNGFFFAPQNSAVVSYDITVLASAFGDDAANSQACSTLQSSLVANNGQGANSVAALPSANSLYGGEFMTTTGSSIVNDPTGASGSENCDVVIDLGTQDPANNGLFPNATIFIGSNYPPFSAAKQWNCPNTSAVCAASFPAAAVVGQVQGKYVIFVVASALSTPAAQLPNIAGIQIPQPAGIYLFQK